ncbi:MAG: carboxypeptidase regulatory-like domain-containing protein [Anaerolineae bacterium]|nr:carboxypeptidase regulatory-like domain-containing protein [Anaerolineae bacterium]
MKRFPPYMIVAVCGILFLSAGMVIITADNDPAAPPTEPIDLLTLTPTEWVAVPVDQAAQPVVIPTDVPPVAPVEALVLPTEVPPQVIVPTVEVVVVQPTADGAPVQESLSVVVPTRADGTVDNGLVVTPVIEQPNQPLGTLPPPVQVLPTVEIPAAQPTIDPALVQPTVQPAVPATTSSQVMGQVNVSLRTDFAGVTILLTLPNGQVAQTQTDAAGNFVFANLPPGVYRLDAGLSGYLSSQAAFTLAEGQVIQLPVSTLVGGDTNLDNRIDLTDAALIAANFDGTTAIANADLNHDGIVDIRDLTAIGAFFGQSGPTAWQ